MLGKHKPDSDSTSPASKRIKSNEILYCRCKKPYVDDETMICCDMCEDWYHLRCIGVSEEEVNSIALYVCNKCKRKYGKITQYYAPSPQKKKINSQPIENDYRYTLDGHNYIVQSVQTEETNADEFNRRPSLFYLNQLAKADDITFRTLEVTSQQQVQDAYFAKLISNETTKKPIGYFTFTTAATPSLQQRTNPKEKPCLRQIFFVKSERRKGHGQQILKYFTSIMQFSVPERFIETPNENMCHTLYKGGYVLCWSFKNLQNTSDRDITETIHARLHEQSITMKNVCVFLKAKGSTALVFVPLGTLNFDTAKSIHIIR
jgi:hypothetical protein